MEPEIPTTLCSPGLIPLCRAVHSQRKEPFHSSKDSICLPSPVSFHRILVRIIRDNARKTLGRAPGTKLFYFILFWDGEAWLLT